MTDPVGPWGEDDARARHDVRSALGLLLADEPGAVWSPADDAVRGRTLQRRRRTRTLGATGLAVALVLVAALAGPLRPGASDGPPLPPAGPTQSVDPADPVVQALARFGLRATAVSDGPSTAAGVSSRTYSVSPSDLSSVATLEISSYAQPRAAADAGLRAGSALHRCGSACAISGGGSRRCAAEGGCPAEYWANASTDVEADIPRGSLVLAQYYEDGTEVDGIATPMRCGSCQPLAFLSTDELSQVLLAAGKPRPLSSSGAPEPGLASCRYGDVKPVPEVDPIPTPFGVVALRVHLYPRNPDVHCTLDGIPAVRPFSGGKVVDGVTAQRGDPGGPVTLGPGEATFGVMLGGCFASAPDALRVTLPGDTSTADVSVAPLVSTSSFDCSRGSAPWVTVSGFAVATTGSGTSAAPGGGSASASAASPTPVASAPDGARALTAAQASASGVRRCTLADLRVTQPWADGATGWNLRGLRVTNTSASSCVVGGWPLVGLVAGGRAVQVPETDGAGGFGLAPAPYAVLLPGGASAEALVAKFRCEVRTSGPVSALRVSLPGSAQTVDVAVSGLSMCAAPDAQANNLLSVSSFAVPRS
ncbi:MAG: DUF4232 domain-containing protein [Frankiales bacterium]|nr:DUF4232 domain-containing protein [Frankiales bacterium]